ncbi:MAG: class I SAM-dependent methyltransferase [Phycisphaerales bacterium JB059]
MLDVCCGRGRHAVALSEMGLDVFGIDRSAGALAHARERAPRCRFMEADTTDPPRLEERFGVVCCLWQSFGYGDDAQNERLLSWMIEHAHPEGGVVLDLYNPEFFRSRLEPRPGRLGDTSFVERKHIRDGRLRVEIEYEDGAPTDVFAWRLYTPEALDAIAMRLGWRVTQACTGFDAASEPSANSPRTQYVFRREQGSSAGGGAPTR